MAGFLQLALGFFDEPSAPVSKPVSPAPASTVTPVVLPALVPVASTLNPGPTPAVGPAPVVHPQATRDILLSGQRVRYAFRRGKRRTIGFVVGPEGLSVSAPRWVGVQEVEAALQEKGPWILRKLQEQGERNRRLNAARIVWADGAAVPYLGRELHLALDAAGMTAPGAAMLDADAAVLRLGLPSDAQAERIRDVVHSWWQRQAKRLFEERCALYAPRLGVRVQRLSLSSAQTRWGSATADGSVRLNWRLIQFPVSTIDYVVVHELAHLREMNHSTAFWDVVRSVLPEFEQAQVPLKAAVPLSD
jgi:hypothetical protein